MARWAKVTASVTSPITRLTLARRRSPFAEMFPRNKALSAICSAFCGVWVKVCRNAISANSSPDSCSWVKFSITGSRSAGVT